MAKFQIVQLPNEKYAIRKTSWLSGTKYFCPKYLSWWRSPVCVMAVDTLDEARTVIAWARNAIKIVEVVEE